MLSKMKTIFEVATILSQMDIKEENKVQAILSYGKSIRKESEKIFKKYKKLKRIAV